MPKPLNKDTQIKTFHGALLPLGMNRHTTRNKNSQLDLILCKYFVKSNLTSESGKQNEQNRIKKSKSK